MDGGRRGDIGRVEGRRKGLSEPGIRLDGYMNGVLNKWDGRRERVMVGGKKEVKLGINGTMDGWMDRWMNYACLYGSMDGWIDE